MDTQNWRKRWVSESGWGHARTQGRSCACRSSGSSTCGGHFCSGFVGKKTSDKLDWNENASHADSAGRDWLAVNFWLLKAVVRQPARFWTSSCLSMSFEVEARFPCMCCCCIHLLLLTCGYQQMKQSRHSAVLHFQNDSGSKESPGDNLMVHHLKDYLSRHQDLVLQMSPSEVLS